MSVQLRTASFAHTATSGTLPAGLEKLPLLTQLNMSDTLISGPLPAGLLMPAMAPSTRITPSSMAPSSFLTLDVSGVPAGDTPLCAPYNLTLADTPSRMRIISGGQPYEVPVCEQYVEWSITLSAGASCLMADVCSPEHQRLYAAHVAEPAEAELDYADAPLPGDTSDAPTLRQRSESASKPGQGVAELLCAATCAEAASAETQAESLLEALAVNVIMTPVAPEDLVSARSHATPEEDEDDAVAPTSTVAAPAVVTPVPPPLVAAGARRRLSGTNERPSSTADKLATMLGNRRLLLPALVDFPPTDYRHHIGSLSALRGSMRRLQQAAEAGAQAPVVKFVTVGVPPSTDAGAALLSAMFSDVLTPEDISVATIEWQGGEAAVEDATAAAAADGGATSSVPGVQGAEAAAGNGATSTPGAAGAATAADAGAVTSSDVPQNSQKNHNSVPRKALIAILTLVAILLIILLVLGCWRWRLSRAVRSLGDGKSSSYLSAGVPMMEEGSLPSDYSRITPASEEYTAVTNLGSLSMSMTGMKEGGGDGSEPAHGAGNNSRRPLWMQVDTSGSIRSMMQSKGRSKSRQNSDSGAASNSDAIQSRSIFPGRSKYMADFPKGSPAKALLTNQDFSAGADKLPPVSGSWNCESELEPHGVRLPRHFVFACCATMHHHPTIYFLFHTVTAVCATLLWFQFLV